MNRQRQVIDHRSFPLTIPFLLSVSLFIFMTTVVISQVILNDRSILGSLNQSDFHQNVYEELLVSISDTLLPTGLPEEVSQGIFTPDDVYQNLASHLTAAFSTQLSDQIYAASHRESIRDSVVEKLNSNIDDHLREINLTRAEVGEEVIEGIVHAVLNNYDDYMHFPFILHISRIANMFARYLFYILLICFSIILLTAGSIYTLNEQKHLIFRYYAFSFGATALMLITAPLVLRIWGGYRRLGISPEFIHNAVVVHIEHTIYVFLLIGVVFIGVQLLCILASAKLRAKLLP